jgi:caffeoyl-CoA O-methyltransferase
VTAGPPDARPVTPVGIATALLASVAARLDAADVDPDVLADLARAHSLVGGLDDYVARCTSPASPALVALEERTRTEPWGDGPLEQEMLSGHVEGAFLRMLVAVTGARRVLEVGMFTGYSALAMAEAMPDDAHLVACEIDRRAVAIAQEAFDASPGGATVDVRVGPAAETLSRLAGDGEWFDLVFLDADKAGYAGYLDLLLDLDLLAADGVVVVDNTLLQGEPWAPAAGSPSVNGAAIADFNARVAADDRLEQVLVPLRDGVTLIRRVG